MRENYPYKKIRTRRESEHFPIFKVLSVTIIALLCVICNLLDR